MSDYTAIENRLRENPRRWLVTGVAGFIGSHLAEGLLALGQRVSGLDDMSAGRESNLAAFSVNSDFSFTKGDIRDAEICAAVCAGADYVLHHAAIASVPRSLEDPAFVESVNSGGFANILEAARAAGVRRVVYASSSAVYGEGSDAPRREDEYPAPLSPYAETKCENERAAAEFAISSTGLRYFNIYGPRQDPAGAYAAVIPKWIAAMQAGEPVEIFGDGETVRDFCYVGDAVRANILAALDKREGGFVYNVAGGAGTTLNGLFASLKTLTGYGGEAVYGDFRAADIRVSVADIEKARRELGFLPSVSLEDGLKLTSGRYGNRDDG